MKRIASGQAAHHGVTGDTRVALAILIGAGCLATAAVAQHLDRGSAASSHSELALESASAADIERIFWDCDYAATTRSMALIDAMSCSVATELFQRTAFGGDFGALLTWWSAHKAVEHAKRDAAAAGLVGVPGPAARL